MLPIITLILIIALPIIFIAAYFNAVKNRKSDISSFVNELPVVNDKLIIIQSGSIANARLALSRFNEMYRLDDDGIQLHLRDLGEDKLAVTFPGNISFDIFCFAINFLQYPTDLKWSAQITGWATIYTGDDWVIPEIAGEQAMFYLPQNDTEYDMVLMTTSQNAMYQISFARSKAKLMPEYPEQIYRKPPVKLKDVAATQFEVFG